MESDPIEIQSAVETDYFARMTDVHLLAIAAHRDDVELTCGGTLIKAAGKGYRTAVIDLTQGEMGTRGTAAGRAAEPRRAAAAMGRTARGDLASRARGILNQ